MPATEIIDVLLKNCRECRQQDGKRVSFTVSDIERNDDVENTVAAFFWNTFGVRVHRSGNKQGRHFAFTFKEVMRQPLAVPEMKERKAKPQFPRKSRSPRQALAFA